MRFFDSEETGKHFYDSENLTQTTSFVSGELANQIISNDSDVATTRIVLHDSDVPTTQPLQLPLRLNLKDSEEAITTF